MAWQKHVMNQALVVNKEGKWVRTTAGILVARQNGKTHLVRMRILAGLFIFGEAQAYGMAQNRRLSLDTLWKVLELIESTPWMHKRLKRVSRTNGNEGIEVWCHHYPNDCTETCQRVRKYSILAATADGARGASADLLYIDELREIGEPVWAAAAPTTRARPNAQTWLTSNAGTAESTVLNDLRSRALGDTSSRLGWWEWSAEPHCKITDVKAWQAANPALGHTVQLASLEDSVARDHPDNVRTELLCQWVDALDSPWNFAKFDAGLDRTLVMDPELPTFMALDMDFNRTQAYLVSAQVVDGGLRIFSHAWMRDEPINELELASEIAAVVRRYKTKLVAYDPRASEHVAMHLKKVGIRIEPTAWSGTLFPTLCDVTMSSMNQGRLFHPGQPELRAQLAMCSRRPASDGGWRIARKTSGSIPAAVALVMAVGHAEMPQTTITVAV